MKEGQLQHELKQLHRRVDELVEANNNLASMEYQARIRFRAYENVIHSHLIMSKLIRVEDIEEEYGLLLSSEQGARDAIKNNLAITQRDHLISVRKKEREKIEERRKAKDAKKNKHTKIVEKDGVKA